MIDKKETKYSYNDLTIEPAVISSIKSRKECNPFVEDNQYLPLFTAPMSTITNEYNINIWKLNKVHPMIPRNIGADPHGDIAKRMEYIKSFMDDGDWVALSLKEFEYVFIDHQMDSVGAPFISSKKTYRICVDLANGHMEYLYKTINKAKDIADEQGYKLIVMTGNIANPETYEWICKHARVDYIRLSIGSGNGCLTTSNSSIHYPIASLIDRCKFVKNIADNGFDENDNPKSYFKSHPYLVADGGIRGYADVIKALGLGADYVMIGSLFSSLLESAAPLNIEGYNNHYLYFYKDGIINNGVEDILNIWKGLDSEFPVISDELEKQKKDFIKDMKSITKEFYGMSTKKAQKLINPSAKTKTSEGCTKYITVKETVKQWTDNMIDYMRSAMSYTDKQTIDEFKGNVNLLVNSSCAILAVNK